MSPKEKMNRVYQLNRSLRTLAIAGIRQRYLQMMADDLEAADLF